MSGLEKKQQKTAFGLVWAGAAFILVSVIGILLLFQWNNLRAEESQAQVPSFVVLELSQIDLGVDWVNFWPEVGFLALDRQEAVAKHVEQAGDQVFTWSEEVEEWFLVPAEPGASLDEILPQLVSELLANDQRLVLERIPGGYLLGSLVRLPGLICTSSCCSAIYYSQDVEAISSKPDGDTEDAGSCSEGRGSEPTTPIGSSD